MVAVVVTYERLPLLREALTAVLAQSRRPDAVVVVDNASSDGTAAAAAAEFPSVDLLRLQVNTGGAGGFSAGLDRAPTLVFCPLSERKPTPKGSELSGRMDRLASGSGRRGDGHYR